MVGGSGHQRPEGSAHHGVMILCRANVDAVDVPGRVGEDWRILYNVHRSVSDGFAAVVHQWIVRMRIANPVVDDDLHGNDQKRDRGRGLAGEMGIAPDDFATISAAPEVSPGSYGVSPQRNLRGT